MTPETIGRETESDRRDWLWKIGAASAIVSGTLLLAGMIILFASVLRSEMPGGWLLAIQDNWLVKIFVLHAGFPGLHADLLGLNLLDILILLLVCVICLSFSTLLRNAGRVWSLIALALSAIAIVLFLATQLVGRSTVMLAVLIISLVMPRDKPFGRITVAAGILASLTLFMGDLTVGVHSDVITTLFGIGYVLLIAWFFLIAQGLYRAGYAS